MTLLLWLALGVVFGTLQMRLLWRAACSRAHAFEQPLRIGLVALGLCAAALAGQLSAATLGWGVGFFATGALVVRRRA